jgi:nucleoside triphosphate diphosphatase
MPSDPTPAGSAATGSLERLLELMERLRDKETGCPWDREQTFATIAPYTIEEAYEVDDAIRRADFDALRDELGDLLLQVVYHAQMAAEAGHFRFGDVVTAIRDKLVRRHPHVFGDAVIGSASEQEGAWEALKAEERARAASGAGRSASAVDGLPASLPALLRAAKLVGRASRAGLPGAQPSAAADGVQQALDTTRERLVDPSDPRSRSAVGQLLFAAAALAQAAGLEPETELRESGARVVRAVREIESGRPADLADTPLADRLARWSRG